MPGYRCYFMSGEHIQAVQNFECTDDAEVILKSSALLNSQSKHLSRRNLGRQAACRAPYKRIPTPRHSKREAFMRFTASPNDRKGHVAVADSALT